MRSFPLLRRIHESRQDSPMPTGARVNTFEEAIGRLYLAFHDVPKPQDIEGCPCCFDKNIVPGLLGAPLRNIAPTELASYAESALLTVGTVADYLYFLPRILEISALDESWWLDIEITARAISTTDLKSWPTQRQQALTSFLHAFIDRSLTSEAYSRLDGWLCAIARLRLDVRPYLSQIEKHPSAVLQYFEDNAEGLRVGKLSNSFWTLPNEGHDAIVRWFRSDAIRKIPFEAYGYLL